MYWQRAKQLYHKYYWQKEELLQLSFDWGICSPWKRTELLVALTDIKWLYKLGLMFDFNCFVLTSLIKSIRHAWSCCGKNNSEFLSYSFWAVQKCHILLKTIHKLNLPWSTKNFPLFFIDHIEIHIFSSNLGIPLWSSNDFYLTLWNFPLIPKIVTDFFFQKSRIRIYKFPSVNYEIRRNLIETLVKFFFILIPPINP